MWRCERIIPERFGHTCQNQSVCLDWVRRISFLVQLLFARLHVLLWVHLCMYIMFNVAYSMEAFVLTLILMFSTVRDAAPLSYSSTVEHSPRGISKIKKTHTHNQLNVKKENLWIIHWSNCAPPMCGGIAGMLPPWHPSEIWGAQGTERWRYCLLFTEEVNICQTVKADEGPSLREGCEFDPARTWAIPPDEGGSSNPTANISVQQEALSQPIKFGSLEETRAVPLLSALQAYVAVNPAAEAISVFASPSSVQDRHGLAADRWPELSGLFFPRDTWLTSAVTPHQIKMAEMNTGGGRTPPGLLKNSRGCRSRSGDAVISVSSLFHPEYEAQIQVSASLTSSHTLPTC